MKKCSKCGTEFEGNCCPKCGTWASNEKSCPKCGTKLPTDAMFCTQCGFAFGGAPHKQGIMFKEKLASVGNWIKSHLKIVIPMAVAVLLVIILACSIPACIAAKDNGTYYKLGYDGEVDKDTYFVIKSGKWIDEDGESGSYKKDGDKIIFYFEFFGSTEELASGTIKDGVLTINEGGYNQVYISENHKHSYGAWETVREATCTTDGLKQHSCSCGFIERKTIESVGHNIASDWSYDNSYHYKLCTVCNQKFYSTKHDNIDNCTICGYPYIFELYNNEYTLKSVYADKELITAIIPAYIKGKPVTLIGNSVFEDCSSLTSVVIPDSVTSIGDYAFYGCSNLTSIEIPDSVTKIGISAFSGCSSLTSVTIGNGVTSINERAFYGCSSLTSIQIPDSVTFIFNDAFYGCDKLIQTENGVQYVDKWIIGCDSGATDVILRADTKGMVNYVFRGCINLTSIEIPDFVTSIDDEFFYGCSNLTSVVIPDSVNFIGEYAFWGCSSLTSMEIPEGVSSICDYTFQNCSSLTNIVIPDSVIEIGYCAFRGCISLTDIYYDGTKAQWNNIGKSSLWNSGIGSYTIHCADGDIKT